jgi:hypothetical protein
MLNDVNQDAIEMCLIMNTFLSLFDGFWYQRKHPGCVDCQILNLDSFTCSRFESVESLDASQRFEREIALILIANIMIDRTAFI